MLPACFEYFIALCYVLLFDSKCFISSSAIVINSD